MKFILNATLTLIFLGLFLAPSDSSGQNKYTVNLIQPDLIGTPEISNVSATNDSKNRIIWNMSLNKINFAIGIYRENVQALNHWELICKDTSKVTNEFIDQSSLPNKQAYRYRISGFDKCGSETALSAPHRTIKLRVVKTGTLSYLLSWNPYEGRPIKFYAIYRGLSSDSMQLIDTVYTTQYNDSNSLLKGDLFYRIEAELADNNKDNSKIVNMQNKTWSNITSILAFTGKNDTTSKSNLQIYPNPFNFQTTIFFPNTLGKPYELSIFDMSGNPLFSRTIYTSQIEVERGNLKEGIYLVRIKGAQIFEGKMMVSKN